MQTVPLDCTRGWCPRPGARNDFQKVVLIPLDPVHDVGIKLIARALQERRHTTVLLPPDLTPEEACERARVEDPDYMVSRTISHGTAEVLAKFVDLCDAMGLRDRARLVVGGLSIRPEMAQEFGFDAGFGPATTPGSCGLYVKDVSRRLGPTTRRPKSLTLPRGLPILFGTRKSVDCVTRSGSRLWIGLPDVPALPFGGPRSA